jgi:hypothetical protein
MNRVESSLISVVVARERFSRLVHVKMDGMIRFLVIFLIFHCGVVKAELSRGEPRTLLGHPLTFALPDQKATHGSQTVNDVKSALSDQLSEHIYAMIEHFKDPDPVGEHFSNYSLHIRL